MASSQQKKKGKFKQIGNMAIDLNEDERQSLCLRGNAIISRLQNHLRAEPEKWHVVAEAVLNDDEYFAKFGSKTARYYMFEQGIIDELGDRLNGNR